MPSAKKSIAEAKAERALKGLGQNRNLFEDIDLTGLLRLLANKGGEFKTVLVNKINEYGLIGTGALASDKGIQAEVDGTPTDAVLRILLYDYFDYINKGVKGIRSSKNAPNSPYQYKTYAMPDDARASLKKYIQSGKAKIKDKKKAKLYGAYNDNPKALRSVESKGLSLEDTKVNTLIYLIKAFGIKKRPYFDETVKKVFEGFESELLEVLRDDVEYSLSGINLKGK